MSLVAKGVKRLRWLAKSSALRLSLLLSLIFAVGMALAIFIALTFGRDAVLRRVDTTLVGLAAATSLDDVENDNTALLIRPLSNLWGLPPSFAEAAAKGGGTASLETDFQFADSWRVVIARDSEGEAVLIAVPIEDSEEALDLLAGVLWTTAGVVVIFTLGIGLVAGIWAERRMARINLALTQLAAGDLQARTGFKRLNDDVDELAHQIDSTAAELERLVTQRRHLSASLAHDLRTPLARLRAQLEDLPEGDKRSAALEEAERLSGIFDTIMRIARIEAGHGTEGFETVDLGEILEDVADIFGPVVEDSGKELKLSNKPAGQVSADRKMLIQALANLIQNAIVHGGDEIEIFAADHEIGVGDNGDGVAPSAYAEIIKPMVRLDKARESGGTGLGLALVRAVADRHGASLQLAPHLPKSGDKAATQASGLRISLMFTEL